MVRDMCAEHSQPSHREEFGIDRDLRPASPVPMGPRLGTNAGGSTVGGRARSKGAELTAPSHTYPFSA
jgi:hypothetical protein